jgi:hypothetical protein
MSIQEPANEAEWITFVSPLVRLVEETSTAGTSPEKDQGASGTATSDPKGKGRMEDEGMVFDISGSGDVGGYGVEGGGAWSDDLGAGIQEDPFNSLMDFGRSK